jgi:hypothetical protein
MIPINVIGRIKNQLIDLFNWDLTGIILKSLTKMSFVKSIQNITNDSSAFLFKFLKNIKSLIFYKNTSIIVASR